MYFYGILLKNEEKQFNLRYKNLFYVPKLHGRMAPGYLRQQNQY